MSTVKVSNVQLGDGASSMNFTLKVPTTPDGTLKLVRGGASDVSLQDLMTIDASNNLYLPTASAPTKLYSDKSTALATTSYVYNHRATAKAWVLFRPTTASILTQHNISAVTRTAAGQYFITMNTSNINSGFGFDYNTSYMVVATGGRDEVGNSTAGENNVIYLGARYQSAFNLYAWEAANASFEDPYLISVVVFGA